MKLRLLVAALAVTMIAALAGAAHARNPHCAGGMQYVSQALRDKDRGNAEDYQREMNKAVDQLSMCATEDTADFEAAGYLGWAYADLDSAGPAGVWFQKAYQGALAKGDKKRADIISTNRDHYWVMVFNDGIKAIQSGQELQESGAKDEAAKSLATAIDKLTRASLLRVGHAQTLRSLATAYAVAGNFDAAEAVLRNGLVLAAGDTAVHILDETLRSVRSNKANALLGANKIDEALAYFGELTKSEPNNADLWQGLGDAYFKRATMPNAATKKADYKAAADAYAKASALNPANADLAFNAALGYQNSGELALAEANWKAVLKTKPNDTEALTNLAQVLADEKKYDDARVALEQVISIKPDDKSVFRQLAGVYSKANNNLKTAEMMFIYLPLANGTPAADPKKAATDSAKPGTGAANTLSAMGAPDKVMNWSDNAAGPLQTWFYTAKKLAFTFNAKGLMVQKSDWNPKK